MRRIRLAVVCAAAALWPVVAFAEDVAPVPPPAGQVTADCTTPTYATDHLVCADPGLRALDADLARVWARAEAAGQVTAGARQAQAAWFRQRSLCAFRDDHRACTEAAYRARIAELQQSAQGPTAGSTPPLPRKPPLAP